MSPLSYFISSFSVCYFVGIYIHYLHFFPSKLLKMIDLIYLYTRICPAAHLPNTTSHDLLSTKIQTMLFSP